MARNADFKLVELGLVCVRFSGRSEREQVLSVEILPDLGDYPFQAGQFGEMQLLSAGVLGERLVRVLFTESPQFLEDFQKSAAARIVDGRAVAAEGLAAFRSEGGCVNRISNR